MEEIYVVKVRTKPDAARLYPSERRYSALTVGGLGAVHLVLGATSLLLGVLGLVLQDQNDCWTTRYGGGLWLGMFALMAGAAGMLAWRRWYVDNNIRWFFASCTISGAASLVCLIVTAAALAAIQEQHNSHNFIYYDQGLVKHFSDGSHPMSPPAALTLLQSSGKSALPSNENPSAKHTAHLDSSSVHSSENEPDLNHLPFQIGSANMNAKEGNLNSHITSTPPSYIMHIANTKRSHNGDLQTTLVSEHSQSSGAHTRRKKSAQSDVDATGQDVKLKGNAQSSKNSSVEQAITLQSDTLNADMTLHSGEDEDTFIVKDNVSTDFHQAPGVGASREVRTVVAINILVASALELAWSILSASIAWKGMRNSYNEGAPNGDVATEGTRTVEGIERSPPPPPPPSSDAYSKHDGQKPSMEEYYRKPDIISNHHRRHFSSKVASKNERNNRQIINTVSERIDHFLPLEESTMEYQERVHRFLASNNLAAPSDTASNVDST